MVILAVPVPPVPDVNLPTVHVPVRPKVALGTPALSYNTIP